MARIDRVALYLTPALLAVCLISTPSPVRAGPGYVNFMFGQKAFDSEDWNPIDKQATFGVEAAYGPGTWPVHIATYVARASKGKDATYSGAPIHLEGTTYEFGVGANKTWTAGKLYPYVSGGGLYAKVDVTASQSGTSTSDDANGFGGWGGAGLFYRVGTTFNVGGCARYSAATVDFNAFQSSAFPNVSFSGSNIAAGGFTFGVLLGWGWPKTP